MVYGHQNEGIWTPLRRRRSLTLTPRMEGDVGNVEERYNGDVCKERA